MNEQFLNTLITVGILLFLALLAWSKLQNQTMLDTFKEIKEIFGLMGRNAQDGLKQ